MQPFIAKQIGGIGFNPKQVTLNSTATQKQKALFIQKQLKHLHKYPNDYMNQPEYAPGPLDTDYRTIIPRVSLLQPKLSFVSASQF